MVVAIIVLYRPDVALLQRLISSLVGHVHMILAIDNTPVPTEIVQQWLASCEGRIQYEPLGENKGIAFAQNIGILLALKAGASHILLLDQDSAVPPNMVSLLLRAELDLLHKGQCVAAVGPAFIDEKTGERSSPFRQGYFRATKIEIDEGSTAPVETEYVIASGSLIRRVAIEEVGMMLEGLFIDLVDIEWGLRAKSKGYRSYVIPSVVIRHSVGERAIRAFGRNIYLHSDIRNYYKIRNCGYLLRMRYMGMRWRISNVLRVPKFVAIYSILSDHKLRTLTLLFRACMDGARAKMGRYR
jgi:rhamnosyltransferase